MTLNSPSDPPSLAHQEILYEKHTREDHVAYVLHACCYIIDHARAGIYIWVFPKGSHERDILGVILIEIQTTFQYKRQRRNMGVRPMQ